MIFTFECTGNGRRTLSRFRLSEAMCPWRVKLCAVKLRTAKIQHCGNLTTLVFNLRARCKLDVTSWMVTQPNQYARYTLISLMDRGL